MGKVNRNNILKISLIVAYVIVVATTVFLFVNLPENYDRQVNKNINDANEKINEILEKSIDDIQMELPAFIEKYPSEVVILFESEPIFQTTSLIPSGENELNQKVVAYETSQQLIKEDKVIQVWYAIYALPQDQWLVSMMMLQSGLMILCGVIMVVFMMMNYRKEKPSIVQEEKPVEVIQESTTSVKQATANLAVISEEELKRFAPNFKNLQLALNYHSIDHALIYAEEEAAHHLIQNILIDLLQVAEKQAKIIFHIKETETTVDLLVGTKCTEDCSDELFSKSKQIAETMNASYKMKSEKMMLVIKISFPKEEIVK